MRHADHRAFQHAGQIVDQALDLFRIDVEAAGDDQVLFTTDDGDIAVGVDHRHVAGDEPAVRAQLFRRFLGHLPIALEHVRPAHLQHADLTRRHLFAFVHHPRLDPRQGKADGAGAALAVIGVRGAHVGFGHAVAFEDAVACSRLPLFVGFYQQRRRAGDEQAHVGRAVLGQPRIGQQPGIERRHSHQRGRLRHRLEDRVGVKALEEDHPRPGQQCDVGGDEQPVGVKDRQRVDQHVAVGKAPVIAQGFRVAGQVGVAQHRALGAPGGARRVQNGGQIVRSARHRRKAATPDHRVGQRAQPLGVQRDHPGRTGDLGDFVGAGGIADHHARRGIAEEIGHLGRGIGGVERQEHAAGHHRAEIELDRLDALVDLHRHPVAGLHAHANQRRGIAFGAGEKLAEGHAGAGREGGEVARLMPQRGRAQAGDQVVVVIHGRGSGLVRPICAPGAGEINPLIFSAARRRVRGWQHR